MGETKFNDEPGRLRALRRLDVLDTPEEAPFEKIVALIRQILELPVCAVSLIDADRQWFKACAGVSMRQTPRELSFCNLTIENDTPFVIRDMTKDPRFADHPMVVNPPHVRSYAGVPLTTPDGYNVGSLCAVDMKPRDFSESEIAILEKFARLVVDELELRQIASTDALTGALSRRAWRDAAEKEIRRARRYGRGLSVAIMDIDRFKAINDAHGHPAGDVVIRTLAEQCLANKRDSDAFGRWGGEEFVMLLPETTAAQAEIVAERARRRFAETPIHAGRQILATISAGVAELHPGGETLDDLIERADKALYAAKEGGRNRTVLADPPAPPLRAAAG